MSNSNYDWKRFFGSRENQYNLSSRGFLSNPNSKYSPNSHLNGLEQLKDTPCLAIIGEPGIGKTHCLRKAYNSSDSQERLFIDLNNYNSQERILSKIFQHEKFQSYLQNNGKITLFLDSLDQALSRIETLPNSLPNKLEEYSLERINLRIACRTADWPKSLENKLKDLWGKESYKIRELAPLREKDVIKAAEEEVINSEDFLQEIQREGVVPLAIKPISLNFLLNIYKDENSLPQTQGKLYKKGCKRLCEETDQERQDTSSDRLSYRYKYAIAKKIASITVLSDTSEIDLSSYSPEEPAEVSVESFSGSRELINGETVQLTRENIGDTLSTGLFSSRGQELIGWAHQSYAEFLAGQYLAENVKSETQILNLLTHPKRPKRIIPKLKETAIWAANKNSQLFNEILEKDPKSLLSSSVKITGDENKRLLVEKIFDILEDGGFIDQSPSAYEKFYNFCHPNITDQLRDRLDESSKDKVQEIAIEIIRVCELQDLESDLLGLALDSETTYSLRKEACYAIREMGSDEAKGRLKPLAVEEVEADTQKTLKGCALQAVWPDDLSAEELFDVLSLDHDWSFLNSYLSFINNDLVEGLAVEDLPLALQWIKEYFPKEKKIQLEDLTDSILIKSWGHVNSSSELLEQFCATLLARLQNNYECISDEKKEQWEELIEESSNNRHIVLNQLVSMISESDEEISSGAIYGTAILRHENFNWLLEKLVECELQEEKSIWLNFVRRHFTYKIRSNNTAVLKYRSKETLLKEHFSLIKLLLASAFPKQASQFLSWYERRKINKAHDLPGDSKESESTPSPKEKVTKHLEDFFNGDNDAWWKLTRALTLRPKSVRHANVLKPDLTELPGWGAIDNKSREEIIEASEKYIETYNPDPDTDEWLGKDTIHPPTFAGYKAFFLQAKSGRNITDSYSSDIWKRWARIIIAYPYTTSQNDEIQINLAEKVYKEAPERVVGTVKSTIDYEIKEEKPFSEVLRKLKFSWDDFLVSALLDKVKGWSLQNEIPERIFNRLFKEDSDEIEEYALDLATQDYENKEEKAEKVVAMGSLLRHSPDKIWDEFWSIAQINKELTEEILRKAIETPSIPPQSSFFDNLDEKKMADLYIWLFERNEEREGEDSQQDNVIDKLSNLRRRLLEVLQKRGTFEASQQIKRLIRVLPDSEESTLQWTLQKSENLTLYKTWNPPKADSVIDTLTDDDLRLVKSEEQLHKVASESLKRLETKLHGEVGFAKFLWDEGKGAPIPKDESSLSDFVKLHLDDDLKNRGIISNREVEIHHGNKRTDIHVDAISKNEFGDIDDKITVIIEVKGCWNNSLFQAIEKQLVDDYLENNECDHGIYLVGWFKCGPWDDDDYRKVNTPNRDIKEIKVELQEQAESISDQREVSVSSIIIDTRYPN